MLEPFPCKLTCRYSSGGEFLLGQWIWPKILPIMNTKCFTPFHSIYVITLQKIDLTMFRQSDNVCKILVTYKTHNWYCLIIPTLHLHSFPLCSDLIYCNGTIYMLWAYMLSLRSHGCGRRQLAGASMITSAFQGSVCSIWTPLVHLQ